MNTKRVVPLLGSLKMEGIAKQTGLTSQGSPYLLRCRLNIKKPFRDKVSWVTHTED